MKSPRIVQLVLFGVVVFGGVETAWADVVYSFTTIDVPGAMGTNAWGINDSGLALAFLREARKRKTRFVTSKPTKQ